MEASAVPKHTVEKVSGEEAEAEKEPSAGEDEETKMLKATRQIEFYFADSNLPYDRFMWTLHTANPEHWVPISSVASFKRMRVYSALGIPWIASALRQFSEELEVDGTGEKVRRRREVQEPKGAWERSIYAKGFGKEEPDTQVQLENFFNKYGKTNAVRMRRIDGKKEFKGSVFVEFADFSSVESFLNADPKPSWKDEELLIMTKDAYCTKKIAEKGLTGKAAQLRKSKEYSYPVGRGRGFNAFKEMAVAGSKAKAKEVEKTEVYLQFMGSKILLHEGEDGEGFCLDEDVPYVKGATLKFESWEGEVSYRGLKEPLRERFSRVPYIKHEKGESNGLVGFDRALTEEDIDFVKDTLKGQGGDSVVWSVAGEEEERTFQLERAKHAASAVFASSRDNLRSGRKGRDGGRGRGRGRGGGGGRGSRPNRGRNGGRGGTATQTENSAGKRKRTEGEDEGLDVGERGQGVPVVESSKKAKTDGEA